MNTGPSKVGVIAHCIFDDLDLGLDLKIALGLDLKIPSSPCFNYPSSF